eukprot:5240954-Amphidinium_carterae.3
MAATSSPMTDAMIVTTLHTSCGGESTFHPSLICEVVRSEAEGIGVSRNCSNGMTLGCHRHGAGDTHAVLKLRMSARDRLIAIVLCIHQHGPRNLKQLHGSKQYMTYACLTAKETQHNSQIYCAPLQQAMWEDAAPLVVADALGIPALEVWAVILRRTV